MSSLINRILTIAVLGALTAVAAPAIAASSATGIWVDHTGRGAVEITDCGGKLCGKIIWLQDAANVEFLRHAGDRQRQAGIERYVGRRMDL